MVNKVNITPASTAIISMLACQCYHFVQSTTGPAYNITELLTWHLSCEVSCSFCIISLHHYMIPLALCCTNFKQIYLCALILSFSFIKKNNNKSAHSDFWENLEVLLTSMKGGGLNFNFGMNYYFKTDTDSYLKYFPCITRLNKIPAPLCVYYVMFPCCS